MFNNQSVFSAEASTFRILPSHGATHLLAQSMLAICSGQQPNVKHCVRWLTWTAQHCTNMKNTVIQLMILVILGSSWSSRS